MKFDFDFDLNTGALYGLETAYHGSTRAKVTIFNPLETPIEVREPGWTKDFTRNAQVAFAMASKIASECGLKGITKKEFQIVSSGGAVKYGDYLSRIPNSDDAKTRIDDALKAANIEHAGFEFYLRHSLLALENKAHNKRPLIKPTIGGI